MKRRPDETIGSTLRNAIAALAIAGALAFTPAARAQVTQLNQSFNGTTAPGWVLGGSNFTPELTAAHGIDPVGSGWLRLTSNASNESTYAYDSTPFASANSTISAQFNLAVYNGSGADGITFFLADSSVAFSAGAYGGSLGYAQKTLAGGGGADINGMAGGYLGVGVDEFGNYSNPTEGRIGGPGFVSNAIAVRGPGTGLTGYDYLGGSGALSTPLSYPGQTTRPTGAQAETIQMILTSSNQLTVSIEIGMTGVFRTVLTADLSSYTRPSSLIMGFTGSTGGSTDIHEIQDVSLTAVTGSLWTNNSADSNWNTANDWAGSPGKVPAVGSDVLLDNTYVGTAQTINVGTTQIIRSLQIDAPFGYTLNNSTLEFNNEGVAGTTGIVVTQTHGSAADTVNSAIKADNAIIVQNNSASNLNLTGALATGGFSVNFNGSGVVNESGIVSGTGSIYETGSGTTTLSGANTYSGGSMLVSGTVNANSSAALGTGGVTLNGGTLASTNGSTLSNTLTLTGSSGLSNITTSGKLTQSGGSLTLNMEGATQSGAVALSEGNTARTLTVESDAGTSTISGIISNGGSGAGSLAKTGAGTLALGGVNTYTGTTTVSGGTLQTNVANAFANTMAITVNTGAIMSLNGNSQTIGSISDAGALSFGAGAANLTLTSGTSLLSGTITGTGTLTLDAGTTLTLGANFNDSGLNIVLAGGTLKLNGTTDTFGSLKITSNSVLDFANPLTSSLSVSGVTLTGASQLSVTNWANMVDYFYSGTSPGTQGTAPIDQIVFSGFAGSKTHWNTYTSGPGAANEISPVPEPATYGAIFVGISLIGIVIHRRKRSAA